MKRLLDALRYALPLALAGTAGAVKVAAGQTGIGLVLVVVTGALLGWAVILVVESAAALGGLVSERQDLSPHRAAELERRRDQALDSIREIELDAALHKIEPEEAHRLTEPLRERATRLQDELEALALSGPRPVEVAIEAEVERRLSDRGASS